jgi:predicted PurR-regulated permease PerM
MTTTGAWFYASTLTGLIDGIFIGAGLLVLDVPLAVPIGALTFVLGYVPLVGATLAGVGAVGVAFVAGRWTTAIWALVTVLAVQQIERNVLSPLLLSRAVDFPPLVTLLLTTTAGLAFGIVGLFLVVPVVGATVAATTTSHQSNGAQRSAPAAPLPPAASTPASARKS